MIQYHPIRITESVVPKHKPIMTGIPTYKVARKCTYFYEYTDGLLSRCLVEPNLWQF